MYTWTVWNATLQTRYCNTIFWLPKCSEVQWWKSSPTRACEATEWGFWQPGYAMTAFCMFELLFDKENFCACVQMKTLSKLQSELAKQRKIYIIGIHVHLSVKNGVFSTRAQILPFLCLGYPGHLCYHMVAGMYSVAVNLCRTLDCSSGYHLLAAGIVCMIWTHCQIQ